MLVGLALEQRDERRDAARGGERVLVLLVAARSSASAAAASARTPSAILASSIWTSFETRLVLLDRVLVLVVALQSAAIAPAAGAARVVLLVERATSGWIAPASATRRCVSGCPEESARIAPAASALVLRHVLLGEQVDEWRDAALGEHLRLVAARDARDVREDRRRVRLLRPPSRS